ncbi:MAG TPA: AraC family transcriptional regulator [Bacillota bacterium]|nr:AraC family transcriptional regulator [Bacillota bacterium]
MNNMIFPLITEYELKLPYFIVGIGCFYNQEHIIRPHGNPYYQWIQCHQGKGELLTGGSTYSVDEGQGMLLYPNESHEYYAISGSWEVDWIVFGGLHIGNFLKQTADISRSGIYYVSKPEIILSKMRKALEVEQSDKPMKSLECSRIAYDILLDIMKSSSLKKNCSLDHQYNRLKPLFDFIDKNYDGSLTLTDMSNIVGVTPQHFCTMFKKATNLRVFEYINLVRIKKSKEYILQHKNLQIKEIARLSGFADVSYFCSQFKKIEKISPNDFRKLHTYD